jgi:hypothetical protein
MRRGNITEKERRQIVALTRRGWKQVRIARKLGITAPSISKAQRAAGLPTRPRFAPDIFVVQFFQEGWPGRRIARHLHMPLERVYAAAHRLGFHYVKPLVGDGLAFVKDVKDVKKRDYVNRLAKKHGVAWATALRLAHRTTGIRRFKKGKGAPPLTSAE